MKFPYIISFAAGILSTPVAQNENSSPDPKDVYIRSINYGGSGCAVGTATPVIGADLQSFSLKFEGYSVSSGPGTSPMESRKNCQLVVNLAYPPNWSYAITGSNFKGHVTIPAGMTAVQKNTYSFTGSFAQANTQISLNGPVDKDFDTRDQIPIQSLVWSKCNTQVPSNVNVQLRLAGDLTKTGIIAIETIEQNYNIQWKKC